MGFPLDLVQMALQQADAVETAAQLILSWLSSDSGAAAINRDDEQPALFRSSQGPGTGPSGVGGTLRGIIVDQDEAAMISWNSGAIQHQTPHPGRDAKKDQDIGETNQKTSQPMVHMNRQGTSTTVLVLLYSYYCTRTTVLVLLYSYYCTRTTVLILLLLLSHEPARLATDFSSQHSTYALHCALDHRLRIVVSFHRVGQSSGLREEVGSGLREEVELFGRYLLTAVV
jgi:hypothetical protein